MSAFARHLDFRPHGDRLLTSSAAFWLFSARILVFAMALAEAGAWGYLGYAFAEGPVRWFTALAAGTLIFLVIWMIDVSLITMDRAWDEHAHRILGEETGLRSRKWKEAGKFTLRIALLIGSLTITAPYLAQLVFHRDIDRLNARTTAARIDSTRTAIDQRYAAAMAAKQGEIDGKRAEYEREVAGQGLSGRFGSGPAAAAIERNIYDLQLELEQWRTERTRELQRFDVLARDPEANRERLATAYNVIIPANTILGNYAALQELRQRPEHAQTEFAIKVFLGLIFAGLLLLKLFEPYSVRLYFSEVLQQEYDRYLAGSFDAALPETERSERRNLSPQRLYSFLTTVWVPARLLEQRQAENKAQVGAAVNALQNVERMRNETLRELESRKRENEKVARARDDALLASIQLQSALKAVRNDIANFESRLAGMAARPDTLDELGWLEHRATLTRKLTEARRALRELEESAPGVENQLGRSEVEFRQSQASLNTAVAEVERRDQELRELRELLVSATSARARSVLKVAS